jgi:hypothetical protein
MIFRALDENHDWTFGNGRNDFLSTNDAIGLNVKTRLLSWVGDCFFDLNAGIDWINRLGTKGQRTILELDLRRVILTSFGVTGITSFYSDLNVRDFTASYEVDTIYSKAYQDTITQGSAQNV